jgi:hypothetical protein
LMARAERITPIVNGTKNIIPLWPILFAKMIRASGESIQLRARLLDVRSDRTIVGSCY